VATWIRIQVVGEFLEDPVFLGALSGSVGKPDGVVVGRGGLLIEVVLVLVDGHGELVDEPLKVGDLRVELVNLGADPLEENVVGLFPFLLGEPLKGEGVVKVLLDVVEDPHDVVDHALVGLLGGSLGDLGEDVEDGGITVGKTLGLGLEGPEGHAQSGEHGGLEELAFGLESVLDDLTGLVEHVPDGVDLGNGGLEDLDLDLSVGLKLGPVRDSNLELGLLVCEFNFTVSKDWGVHLDELGVLVHLVVGGVDGHLEVGHVSLANVVPGVELSFSITLLLLEALLHVLNELDDVVDVGLRVDLELDGLDKGLTEFGVADLKG